MYSYEKIKECYDQLLQMKADKQKENIDVKSEIYKQELDRRANEFKRKVQEDAQRQIAEIDNNTICYKKHIEVESEMYKKKIDDVYAQKRESKTLTLDEVQGVIDLLNK